MAKRRIPSDGRMRINLLTESSRFLVERDVQTEQSIVFEEFIAQAFLPLLITILENANHSRNENLFLSYFVSHQQMLIQIVETIFRRRTKHSHVWRSKSLDDECTLEGKESYGKYMSRGAMNWTRPVD